MFKRALVTATAHTQKQWSIFGQTLQMAGRRAGLSPAYQSSSQTKLVMRCIQPRARKRAPIGQTPWEEWRPREDEDDDEHDEPATN
jgi:hypothetical protein